MINSNKSLLLRTFYDKIRKMTNKIEYFGKLFLRKDQEPQTTQQEHFVEEWYEKHADTFSDPYKGYFANLILHKMYYVEKWCNLEVQENFTYLFFNELEKRINNVFNENTRENKVKNLKYLYNLSKNKKKKVFKINRRIINNCKKLNQPSYISHTEIIQLL